jgi:hypothetical protein
VNWRARQPRGTVGLGGGARKGTLRPAIPHAAFPHWRPLCRGLFSYSTVLNPNCLIRPGRLLVPSKKRVSFGKWWHDFFDDGEMLEMQAVATVLQEATYSCRRGDPAP